MSKVEKPLFPDLAPVAVEGLLAHDIAAASVAHAGLVGALVAAVLQVDGRLGSRAHVVGPDIRDVPHSAHGHSGLGRALV